MIEKTEYAVRAVTTKKVFPKVFKTKDDAEKNRQKHADPEHWEIVKRNVLYGEWEIDKN